ncbi:cell wall anchor protein [Nocardiopsis sediminis]|uniref:Cell wall anchor protein n=1 Tax=Nocardiopsis sediminis TaxID=1778267 RepID=A0ABV8FP40_9ACTN
MSAGQMWVLIGLGVFHGANPGMGWLLAVARGLQGGGRGALLRCLPVLAAGHAASVAAVAVTVTATGSLVASRWFPAAGGACVAAAGAALLLSRHRPRPPDAGMPLWRLGAWSFVMASLHGAGLMLLPVLAGDLSAPHGVAAGGSGHAHGPPAPPSETAPPPETAAAGFSGPADITLLGVAAAGVHTAAMFAAAGVLALLAYDFLGVHALRRGWVGLDRVWPLALIAGGLFTVWAAMTA